MFEKRVIYLEENKEGKKPVKIVKDIEKNGKKPIRISNNVEILKERNVSDKNSGFQKPSKKSKIFLWILISIIIIFIICIIINNIPADIESIKNSVVMIKVYDEENNEISTGSGFCAYESNYIVTNFHVIEGAYRIKIITDNNKEYNINEILIFSSSDDLAIISGDFELKPLKIGSSSNHKAGETITAIGSPKGQLNTVSTGVISNADNDYEIRITAPISPGSSGGALFDKQGRVIGITFATYNSIDSQNINYAISVKYLNDMYNSLKDEKYKKITNANYKSYVPDITNTTMYYFETIPFESPDKLSFKGKSGEYYATNTIDMFYKATNKRGLFESALSEMGEYSLKDEYFQMTDNEKDEVVSNYEILQTYNSYNRELSDNIYSWSKEQFILELKLMQCQDLAIFLVHIDKFNNQKEFVELLEKMGNSYEDKILIHRVIYENDNSYNNDICEALDEIDYWTYEQKVEILEYLGMNVDSEGTVTW